ncbi:Dcp1p-Dcp2p decapping enzyme complex alpha subunit [Entophlyctis luteolus]|nr:Dcp1p-Dcp2p decapping enzyme complex alpha subunit [Entophlyctis luteolus]
MSTQPHNPLHQLPDIPGQLVNRPYLDDLRRHTSKLFGIDVSGHREPRFPGAQPVSFNKSHLEELEAEDYYVSEKADGIRCLLLTTRNPKTKKHETFLIDRKNSYYYLNLLLPKPDNIREWQVDTVLDGELVLDVHRDGTKTLWFDLKPLHSSYNVTRVFDQIPQLKHKNDGVIFTSAIAPYAIGTCEKMIKWKPSEENTVDFKVDGPDEEGRFYIMLNRGGIDGHVLFGEFTLSEDMYKEFSEIHEFESLVNMVSDG